MNRRILLGMSFTLALAILPSDASAQAAAETALANSAASAATAKAGSALGPALNQATKKLAGRVQQQVSPPVPGKTSRVEARAVSTSPAKDTPAREGTTTAPGPMIASIQGGAASCAPKEQAAPAPGDKAATGSAQTARAGQECAGKPAPQKYKPVITLSFSK